MQIETTWKGLYYRSYSNPISIVTEQKYSGQAKKLSDPITNAQKITLCGKIYIWFAFVKHKL